MAGTGHPPGKPKHKVRNLLLLRKGIFRFKMLEEISGEYCQGKEEIKNLILEASPCFEPAGIPEYLPAGLSKRYGTGRHVKFR